MPDGRWQTYVKDPETGKRKLLRRGSKEELTDLLILYYQDGSTQIDKLTVDDMYHEWITEYKIPMTSSANTITRHDQHYKRYLKETALFKTKLKKVKKLNLQAFCNQLIKDWNMTSKEFTNVKTILKGLFEYALDKEYIRENPMEQVRITVKFRQVTRKTGKTETFNSEELEQLINYLDLHYKESGDLSFLAVKVNFYLGLRIGELCALKWKDLVDMKHLHIEREEVRDQTTGKASIVDHTKTNTDRTVMIIPKAAQIFNEIKLHGDAVPTDEGFIFTRDGERLRARQIEHVLDKYSERTGTIKKSSHKIRKTYASNLNAAGVPLDEIRSQLGHTNLNTTMQYIFNPLTEQETFERIKSAFA